MKRLLYQTYQIVVLLPFVVVATTVIFGSVGILCLLFDKDKVMHPMSRIWGKSIIRMSLLPISIEGMDRLSPGQQYIYVSNHCSYYDVPLLSGFLPYPTRWMMKRSLERIPFFGIGCKRAGFVYVDKGGITEVKATYNRALSVLKDGASLIIFSEGRRSDDGHLAKFSRTPFTLACEMNIPVVPITINGTFEVLPRQNKFLERHPIGFIVHEPITPQGNHNEQVRHLL